MPRQSLQRMGRNRYRRKIIIGLAVHLAWDLLLLIFSVTIWSLWLLNNHDSPDPLQLLLFWSIVLLPSVALKILLLIKGRRISSEDLTWNYKALTIVMIFCNFGYSVTLLSVWNTINVLQDFSLAGGGLFVRMMFELASIYSSTLNIFFIFACIFLAEWGCKVWKQRSTNSQDSRELNLISRRFNPFRYKEHEECVICLVAFEAEQLVTVLPCDIRHYFHARCVQSWSR